jgi:hypothetical protein
MSCRFHLAVSSLLINISVAACRGEDEAGEIVGPSGPETVVFDVGAESVTSGLPADFGVPCSDNTECLSGFCVEGPAGFVCTTGCVETCPSGWQCRGIVAGSSDLAFVCVPGQDPGADVVGSDSVIDRDLDPGADGAAPTDSTIDRDALAPSPIDLCGLPLSGAGEVILAEGPGGDAPDCLLGCDRTTESFPLGIDLSTDAFTAVDGIIDGGTHRYGGAPGPDIDIVALRAPARTMLELAIQRADAASTVDPFIYVTDGFAIRALNRNASNHADCARTTLAFPWAGDLSVYVVIEDTANADAWTPDGYAAGSWVGGPDRRWRLRVRTAPFAPIELGVATNTLRADGQVLGEAGLTRYYRFEAPGTADLEVRIAEAPGADPALHLFAGGMKTMLGALEWQQMTDDGGGSGSVTLTRSAFRPCVPAAECFEGNCNGPQCTDALVEYVFAVGDWEGAGGPEFRYQVEVRRR